MNNTVFWSWNNKIDKSELKKQIFSMSEQGINGFFIHARDGLTTEYMGEEWFSDIEYCIDIANQVGIDVWLYDENGWPSGNAGGLVEAEGNEYRGKKLCFSTEYNTSFAGRIIAAYKKVSLDTYTLCDKTSNADLYAYYDFVANCDRMYEGSGAAFIGFTHEKYKQRLGRYFGCGIKGIFFDEPGNFYFWPDVNILPWSSSFEAGFKKYTGKDIIPVLWELYVHKEVNTVLSDYVKVAGKLFKENFILPIQKWCRDNGLILTGHFCMEESLHTSLRMAGNVMDLYRETDAPGIDFLGRRVPSPLLTKQISSVKAQFGKTNVMCECFGASGWDMTFTELLATWKYFAVRGINMPCYHLSAYSIEGQRKFDYPGFFSYQSFWWDRAKAFTDEMSILNEIAGCGKENNDILVLNPLYSLSAYLVESVKARNIVSKYRQLLEELDACQYLYDIGDEDLIKSDGRVENGKIIVGECSYKYVVVPTLDSLERSTLNILKLFSDQGGKVVFIEKYPNYIDFEKNDELDRYIDRFKNLPYENITFPKRNLLKKAFKEIGYKRKVKIKDASGNLSENVLIRQTFYKGKSYVTVYNTSAGEQRVFIEVCGVSTAYEKTISGRKKIDYVVDRNGIFFEVNFKPKQLLFFVFEDGDGKVSTPICVSSKKIRPSNVRLADNNYMVLDKIAVSFDGIKYSESKFTTLETYKNYKYVKYEFCVESICRDVCLLIENGRCDSFAVNGRKITVDDEEWLIDRSIKSCDITKCLVLGKNEIVVCLSDNENRAADRIDDLFLCGEFDVVAEGVEEYPTYYSVSDFRLKGRRGEFDPNEDLTKQGLWSFGGKAVYKFTYQATSDNAFLSMGETNGVVADVVVNGKNVGSVADFNKNIPIPLNVGENDLEIVLYSHNGNVFGPRHHINGFMKLVSPDTFMGRSGTGELATCFDCDGGNVFSEKYYFSKFGIKNIEINECRNI